MTGRIMTAQRRRVASKNDLTFVRSVIIDVIELTALRKMVLRKINAIRHNIVQRVVTALYRRYNSYTKHLEDRPGFLEWVSECKQMHKTYRNHSYETRMIWATRPVVYAARPDLSFQIDMLGGDTASNEWYFQLMEELINARDPREDVYLHVSKVLTGRVPGEAQPAFKLKRRKPTPT